MRSCAIPTSRRGLRRNSTAAIICTRTMPATPRSPRRFRCRASSEGRMNHATAEGLAPLTALLAALRAVPGLVEKRPGVFYRKGKAFLHFHEDPAGLFADVRPAMEWERIEVSRDEGQAVLLG